MKDGALSRATSKRGLNPTMQIKTLMDLSFVVMSF